MSDKRMISIHPNSIGFGYVVLNDKGEILDYGMVSMRPKSNDKCLRRIDEIISYYQPKILILENCENARKSIRVKKLIARIAEYGKNNLKIFKYSREEIRNTFDVFGVKNKYERSKKISEIFSELKSKLPDKRKLWEPENYYQGIFDAVALVLVHFYLEE